MTWQDNADHTALIIDCRKLVIAPTKLLLRIGAPVEKLDISGAWSLAYHCPSVKQCSIVLNGATDCNFTFGSPDLLRLQMNGASDCTLQGAAKRAEFELNGAGNVDALALSALDAKVTANGAGNCSVTAVETLSVEINGVGSVTYGGHPQVTKTIHGLGSIRQQDGRP
jgi:hypothetical protein